MNDVGSKIVLKEYGKTPADAVENMLIREEMPCPDVSRLGTKDVLVAVRSAGIAFVDLIMMTGQYQHALKPPYVPGIEFSGEVIWTGSDVTSTKVGARVLTDFMAVGPRSKSAEYQKYGGWSNYAVMPEEALHPLPDSYSFEEGCSLLANFETPYFALVKRAQLQPGETILITGATGAAGMAAVQIAKLLGATVIATGRSEEKLKKVQEFGADHVIITEDMKDEDGKPRFREAVKDLTGGRGADAVYDAVGGAVGYEALRSLAFMGRYVIVGWASNVSEDEGRKGFVPDRLPTNIIQMKGLQVMGSPMVIYSMQNPEWRQQQLGQVLAWAAEGKIRPFVSHRFSFDEYQSAAQAKLGGHVTGSCVIQIDRP